MPSHALVLDGTALPGAVVVSSTVSPPEIKAAYVDVPGAHGSLDLSTSLTGGEPRYAMRTLAARVLVTATSDAQAELDAILDAWHGRECDINTDGRPGHWHGRLTIDGVHPHGRMLPLLISALVEPWRWDDTSTTAQVTASSSGASATIPPAPFTLQPLVTASAAGIVLTSADGQWTAPTGPARALDGFTLRPAPTPVTATGTGVLTISWRGASLT